MKFSFVRTDAKNVTHLSTRTVEAFIERIKSDTKAGDVARFRQAIALNGGSADAVKTDNVASVYPSVELEREPNGTFRTVAYNGVVTLHVGGLMRPTDREQVKVQAATMPMTMAAFTGADGRSVELLVSIAASDGRMPKDEMGIVTFYQTAYDTAFAVYEGLLSVPLERHKAGADSSFLMPLDSAPYYNPDATPLKIVPAQPAAVGYARQGQDAVLGAAHQEAGPDYSLYADYEQAYGKASMEAYEETADVVESQRYHAYLTELTRRLCKAGLPEEEAFIHIRNHHLFKDNYDEPTLRAIVATTYTEECPTRTDDTEGISQETRRLINFLTTRYAFRRNSVMGYAEYRPNNSWVQDWQVCDEVAINAITIDARLAGFNARDKDVRRYVRSTYVRNYDPIEDYLWQARGKWDGKTDHIALLARTVPCDLPRWEGWFRKWLLSMVAQWMGRSRRYGNSVVPLLVSPQGDNKSTFCRMLLPDELQWGYCDNLQVNMKQQVLQAMHQFLLINLDEFNQVSPRLQEGFLKNVIQLPTVKVKRPYGRHVEEFPRRASFIATSNEAAVLSDPTGSRRFIGVQLIGPIDISSRPNYQALYAQAIEAIEAGETYWFDASEVQAVMAHNRQFQQQPPALQYFHEYFEAADNPEVGQWLTVTAIYQHLRRKAGAGLQANGVAAFGRHLASLPSLQSRRIATGKQYLVREK